jgi:hypothetical protein
MGELITIDFTSKQRPSAAEALINIVIETLEPEDFADFAEAVLSGSESKYRQLDQDMQEIVRTYRALIA